MIDISIVTPTFNRAHLLSRVWKSLLLQDANFEWIIVNDGSTDNTNEIVDSFDSKKIKLVALTKNSGVNFARNSGVDIAEGRYIIFLDSDDELYPDSLSYMIKAIDSADLSIGVVGFSCVYAETGACLSKITNGQILGEREIVCEDGLDGGDKILIYRRDVFDRFRLPADLRGCEHVFVYELSKQWKYLMLDKPGSIIHRQEDNLSSANGLIKRSLDIAKSHELIIRNHSDIFEIYPGSKFKHLLKSLYRYGVAKSTKDVFRIYGDILNCSSLCNIIIATIILPICLFALPTLEFIRIYMLNKRISGKFE